MENSNENCPVHFTPREHDICRLVFEGLLLKQIGDVLHISINTVSTFLKSIYTKTNCHDKPQLIVWLMKHPACL